jgi:hypothetical protein
MQTASRYCQPRERVPEKDEGVFSRLFIWAEMPFPGLLPMLVLNQDINPSFRSVALRNNGYAMGRHVITIVFHVT